MIKAKLTTQSHKRDDALRFLRNKLDTAEWSTWKRVGDISLTMRRPQFKSPIWIASTELIIDEEAVTT